MNKARNIFLVGPMGAGKTTVGKQLAKQLGLQFFDVDTEIERRTGADVSWIFEKEGEHGFRRRETQAIDELTARHGIVLATGGGSVLKAENRRLLRCRGTVVFLRTSVERQLQRLSMDKNRPLLQTKDRESKLRDLASNRNHVYEELADLAIESDGRSIYAMAKLVQNKIDDVFASF